MEQISEDDIRFEQQQEDNVGRQELNKAIKAAPGVSIGVCLNCDDTVYVEVTKAALRRVLAPSAGDATSYNAFTGEGGWLYFG